MRVWPLSQQVILTSAAQRCQPKQIGKQASKRTNERTHPYKPTCSTRTIGFGRALSKWSRIEIVAAILSVDIIVYRRRCVLGPMKTSELAANAAAPATKLAGEGFATLMITLRKCPDAQSLWIYSCRYLMDNNNNNNSHRPFFGRR